MSEVMDLTLLAWFKCTVIADESEFVEPLQTIEID